MTAQPFAGVLVPVLTPFTADGEPDAGRVFSAQNSQLRNF